jgi:predicted  nucleic acid-binding Zn-ribbon protein
MEELLNKQKDLIQKLDDTTSNMKKLREDIDLFTKDNEMTFQEIQRRSKDTKALADHPLGSMESEEYQAMEKDEESLMTRITKLEHAIQKNSHKRLTER